MSRTKRLAIIIVILVVAGGIGVSYAIQVIKDGGQAYLFGYPLVVMDVTRQSMIDASHGKRVRINCFTHVRRFPDHSFRHVVRPNNDTLYSSVWLDLTEEPLVLSVPDTAGRYYVLPLMDAWTNVFASVGKRTTGTGAGNYLVAGPEWSGQVPSGTSMIKSPTNISWLIGRIQAKGRNDLKNVAKIQDQIKLTPLSRWPEGKANPAFSSSGKPQETNDNPSIRVEQMTAERFFAELSHLMGKYPPARADRPILEKLAEFGIVPGESFDMDKLGFFRRFLLVKSVAMARNMLQEAVKIDRSSSNGWTVKREGIGVYGTQYDVRAFVARFGLGALEPVEAAYPRAVMDSEGRLLSGEHAYRIHFDAGKTPPVDAFWSITVYDQDGFLIENPISRYTIGDRDDLQFNSDGSLDILIQNQRPEGGISNWLPVHDRTFKMTLRLYMPKTEFLKGSWKLPPIERID